MAKLDRQELVDYLDKYSCIDNIELIRKSWQNRQPLRDYHSQDIEDIRNPGQCNPNMNIGSMVDLT